MSVKNTDVQSVDTIEEKDIYCRNMEALEMHHPELVALMDAIEIDEEKIQVQKSESGHPRVLYRSKEVGDIYIHNADDPSKCAVEATELLGQMDKEGIAVLFGFGLGYFSEELFKLFEKGHMLMVYEAVPDMFKTALLTRDLTGLLKSDKVKIILGEGEHDISLVHSHHHLLANGKFWVLKHHPSVKLNEKAYDLFFKKLNDEKRISDSQVATAIGLGKEFIHTYMENIPSIVKRSGVLCLKDVFKDRPAIVVAAGPSLEKNIHLLKKAKGKALIIAVDVVLPTLIPAGILPDILVAIDPLADNAGMFRDNPRFREVPFICFGQYTPEIVRMYPGPVFINSVPNNAIHPLLGTMWDDKGFIECFGGSVAHFAFAAAEYIGSNVIAMIGLDLSFASEKKYHAGDTTKLLQDAVENPDYNAFSNNFMVKDIFGETRYSMTVLLVFKTGFENRIRHFAGKVIHATEGGLPLKGASPMRLSDFIEEYCDIPEIDYFGKLSELADEIEEYQLEDLITAVETARDTFIDIKKNSNRVLKYIKRLKTLKKSGQKDSQEFHSILDKVEAIIDEIRHPLLNIISGYNYGLELYMKKQDVTEIDDIEDKWEKLDKQLDRGEVFYRMLVDSIERFNHNLNKLLHALKLEEQADRILEKGGEGYEELLKVAHLYEKAGFTALAATHYEKAMKMETAKADIGDMTHMAALYVKQFRFFEARELLENIKKETYGPLDDEKTRVKVNELLKKCNAKICAWSERTGKMEELVRTAEGTYGSDLESGLFYFRVGDFKRAEKAYLNAIPAEPSDVTIDAAPALYGLAHTYLAVDDPEKAFEALEKAIGVDPENPIYYRDIGFIAAQNNDISSAEIFFIKAIELKPDTPELYKPLASLYVGIGEQDKAIQLYETALLSDPGNLEFQQELAMLLREMIAQAKGL